MSELCILRTFSDSLAIYMSTLPEGSQISWVSIKDTPAVMIATYLQDIRLQVRLNRKLICYLQYLPVL